MGVSNEGMQLVRTKDRLVYGKRASQWPPRWCWTTAGSRDS